MAGGERVAGRGFQCVSDRLKRGIENPGTVNAKGDFQPLNRQSRDKIDKSDSIGQFLIDAPENGAEKGDYNQFFP